MVTLLQSSGSMGGRLSYVPSCRGGVTLEMLGSYSRVVLAPTSNVFGIYKKSQNSNLVSQNLNNIVWMHTHVMHTYAKFCYIIPFFVA
jgi:hypothetical protein